MLRICFALVVSASLVSCASYMTMSDLYRDGQVKEIASEFDGTKETTMYPTYLRDGTIKLGAFRNSKMGQNEAFLIAEIPETKNIDEKESLQFNIDGKIVKLSSQPGTTKFAKGSMSSTNPYETRYYSSRQYLASRDLIKSILSANKVAVKLVLLEKTYMEDVLAALRDASAEETLKKNGMKNAKDGLTEFYQKVFINTVSTNK